MSDSVVDVLDDVGDLLVAAGTMAFSELPLEALEAFKARVRESLGRWGAGVLAEEIGTLVLRQANEISLKKPDAGALEHGFSLAAGWALVDEQEGNPARVFIERARAGGGFAPVPSDDGEAFGLVSGLLMVLTATHFMHVRLYEEDKERGEDAYSEHIAAALATCDRMRACDVDTEAGRAGLQAVWDELWSRVRMLVVQWGAEKSAASLVAMIYAAVQGAVRRDPARTVREVLGVSLGMADVLSGGRSPVRGWLVEAFANPKEIPALPGEQERDQHLILGLLVVTTVLYALEGPPPRPPSIGPAPAPYRRVQPRRRTRAKRKKK